MESARQKKAKKGKLGLVLGIVISLGIIAAFAYALDWKKFATELSKVSFPYLVLYLLVFILSYGIRALRWRYLLPADRQFSLRYLYDSFSVGLLATFILPFRAGEFVRAWSLSRWQNVSFGIAFASIVAERVFDILALLFILWICLLRVEDPPTQVTSAALVLGLVAGSILVVMLMCYFCADWLLKTGESVLRFVMKDKNPKLQQSLLAFATEIIAGFRSISSFKQLLTVIILSFATWLLLALSMQIGLWCFGEFPSLWVGLTANAIVALAVAVPSAPGFIGTYQAGCWLSLSLVFGYPREFSIAYAVVVHALQALVVFALGLVSLQRNGLAIGDLRRSKAEAESEPQPEQSH